MTTSTKSTKATQTEVVIIGGGIVGCAMARRFTLAGASVVLIEKAPDILDGASKGNSAILHTGFDAPVGSVEHQCIQQGYAEYLEIRKSMNLPLLKSGAMVAAWTKDEEDKLEDIYQKGLKNGVDSISLISSSAALKREPKLSKHIRAAILIPNEFVIDPWSAPHAYLLQAVENGAQVICNAEVIDGQFDGTQWQLETTQGTITSKYVINCAGLYGDIVNERVLKESTFQIKPRKGQFVVFDKAAQKLMPTIILPVPTKRTKGIVVFPTIFGNLAVGPTAEEQDSRDDASVDKKTLEALHTQALSIIPALKDIPITATYAGIRPATERAEYRISADHHNNWVTVGGIRSTGLTAALGISQYVEALIAKTFFDGVEIPFENLKNPVVPKMPNLAEYRKRDCNVAGYEEVVCHCELVTDREIKQALTGPLAAKSLAGLKRKTRATMGRCQGFYCLSRLAELTDGKFEVKESLVKGYVDKKATLSKGKGKDKGMMNKNTPHDFDYDVLIIGAGPSGIAAALELKKNGISKIVILERESEAGGIPRHCGHPPFGVREFNRILTGPSYAKRLSQQVHDAGIELRLRTTVVTLANSLGGGCFDSAQQNCANIISPDGAQTITAKRILIATGARETPRSARMVSGDRATGICNTGALQSMVYLKKLIPFKRPIIIGSELVSFSALWTCKNAGIKPIMMLEENAQTTAKWGVRYMAKLFGVPLNLNTKLSKIMSENNQVSAVKIIDSTGKESEITCDSVLFTGQFTPESTLARMANITLDESGRPIVNEAGQCSNPVYYAVGNLIHYPVQRADECWDKGRQIGRSIAKSLSE